MFCQKLQLIFAVFLLLFGFAFNGIAKPSSTQGRHFIVGFMQNEIPRPDLQITYYASIFISATEADTLTVRIGGETPQLIAVLANRIYEIKLNSLVEINDFGTNINKLIDIRSKHPIVCWAYSSKNNSSDSYVVLPVGIWGNEYRVVSMPNDQYNGRERLIADNVIDGSTGEIFDQEKYIEHLTPRSGEFLIMANLNGTTIEYYPTCDTRNGVLAGQKGIVTLNAGECLLVQALGGDVGTQDLTGTLIQSDNPIGVISGHVRTAVAQGLDNPYDTKDHLLEMLPPTDTWGKKFISIPFVDGRNVNTNNYNLLCTSGDMIKVVTKEDNTLITYSIHNDDNTFTEHQQLITKVGGVFTIESSKPILWESDKPVMISQFMMHKGNEGESQYHDPAYVVLAPIEQYMTDVSFPIPQNNNIFDQYSQHCFIAITDTVGINNLIYDGQPLRTQSAIWAKQIGNSEYYWIMIVIEDGSHRLIATKGKFSGIIYGHGFRDSYAMTLGSRLTDPTREDTTLPVVAVADSCNKVTVTITDIPQHDDNASGIDWGYVKNVVNYKIEQFNISDTATVVEFSATPIDSTKNASFDIEFIDKNYNIIKKNITYSGFSFDYKPIHNFGLLSWNVPTYITLEVTNKSSTAKQLLSIIQPSDKRLEAKLSVSPSYNVAPNETIIVGLTFTPDGSIAVLDTKLHLQFECNIITIDLKGRISAPGLMADNLDFYKVRLYEYKTLTGKLYNAGNVNLQVYGVVPDIVEPAFGWLYSEAFPASLPIGDSLDYTVTFSPTELKTYTTNTIVPNDNNANCQFYVKGIGACPDIENIVLDWGRRRVGTTNDTVISIVNAGNFDDTVKYKSEKSITHPSDLSKDSISKITNLVMPENSNQNLVFSYTPQDITPMENVFELTSSWIHHRPILATFRAQGTLPVVESFDYLFNDVPIYSTQTVQHNAVLSSGNEALTIDSIVLLSGDTSSFEIDYLQLYNVVVEPQDYCIIPISFVPKFEGLHRIYLEITHDANPNYMRSKDTIEITGICVTENTNLVATLKVPTIFSCQTQQATLSLENIGEAKINIDSILIEQQPDVINATMALNTTFPIEFGANEKLNFPVNIYAERNENTDLNVNIFYNSGSVKQITQRIEPQVTKINSMLIMPQVSIIPGDELTLHCKASITQKSEKLFDYKIILRFNKNLFYCLEKKCYISVTSNLRNQVFEAKVEQYNDHVEFDLSGVQFEVTEDNTVVEFSLPLLALLSQFKETELLFELSSDRCYESAPFSADIQVESVCADDLRTTSFDQFAYMLINQNPVENEIDLTINLMENDDVTFIVTDVLGNEIYRNKQVLAKGKHVLSIPLDATNLGEYFITARCKQLDTTQKILLIKN